MSKPSSTVTWATDTNYSSGPESGQSTRLEPASGVKAQGFIPTQEAPARWVNWVLGKLGEWTGYLNNLHAETDFTGQNFDWGGSHNFEGYITLESGSTLQVDGDTFFNNDIFFTGWTDSLRIGDEILYSNSIGASPTPRARTVMVPLGSGILSGNVSGAVTAVLVASGAPSYWYWPLTSGQLTFPLGMPRGATLTSVRVGVSNQSGGTVSMTVTVFGKACNKTTPSASSAAAIDTETNASIAAAADYIFTMTPGFTVTVDNSVNEYFVAVSGQVDCRIHWIELNYTDPGPRNG